MLGVCRWQFRFALADILKCIQPQILFCCSDLLIISIMSNGSDSSASNDAGFAACFQQCCSGIWQKIKEGRRKTQARWLCAISIIGCSFVAITSVTSGCVPTILIAMSV
jgi:hypothetical protein